MAASAVAADDVVEPPFFSRGAGTRAGVCAGKICW